MASPEPAVAGPAQGRHLLLHDRDEEALERAARYFRGLGYTVDTARQPHDGEALLRHRRYDLAIVDVWSTAAEMLVREISACDPATRVIVLAAPLTDELKEAARRLGLAAAARPVYLPDLGHLAFSLTGVLRA